MDAKETVDIIFKVRTDNEVKLRYGLARRDILAGALGRGEEPEDRRIEWITTVVQGMRQMLMESARVFNESYPQDRISTRDMQDCLNTVARYLHS